MMNRTRHEHAVRSAVVAALSRYFGVIDALVLAELGELMADAVLTHPAFSTLGAASTPGEMSAAPADGAASLYRTAAVIHTLARRFAARHGGEVDVARFVAAGARAANYAANEPAVLRGEVPFEQLAWGWIYRAMCAAAPRKPWGPAKNDALAHAQRAACDKLALLECGGRQPWDGLERVLGQLATGMAVAYLMAMRPAGARAAGGLRGGLTGGSAGTA